MNNTDQKLISEEKLEHGFKLQRVINKAGVPFSVVVGPSGEEMVSVVKDKEDRMLEYWKTSGQYLFRKEWTDE